MLNAPALGKSCAFVAGLFWIVCSLLVYIFPEMMMTISGHMVHADLTQLKWYMPTSGFIVGLVVWTIFSGLFGWMIAIMYNKLN